MRKTLIRTLMVVGSMLALTVGYVWFAMQPPSVMVNAPSAFTLSGVTLVNPMQNRRTDQRVRVAEGLIQKIETRRTPASGEEALYQGSYVLPGLVDIHTHLPPNTPLNLTGYFCFLYLSHGITSIRDTGDLDGTAVARARTGDASGAFSCPRVYACGPYVGGDPPRWVNTRLIRQPGDAAAAVVQIKADGFDCIKAYDELTLPQINELKEAARQHDLRVIGHVPAQLAYEDALLPEVQHLFGVPDPSSLGRDHIANRMADWQAVDDARMDVIVATTLQHGLVNTPTLVTNQQLLRRTDYQDALADPAIRLVPRLYREVVWHPEEGIPVYQNLSDAYFERLRQAFEKKKILVRRLYEAGAALLLGTDVQQPFVVPGVSLHQEMEIFDALGIPAEEVWALATRKAGEVLGLPMLGTIQEGAPADLLIFREDPTQDLAALASLEAVISQGRLFTRQELDAASAAYHAHFNGEVFDALSVTLTRQIMRKTIKRDY